MAEPTFCQDCGFIVIPDAKSPCGCTLNCNAPRPERGPLDAMTLTMGMQDIVCAIWEALRRGLQAEQRGDIYRASRGLEEAQRLGRQLIEQVRILTEAKP